MHRLTHLSRLLLVYGIFFTSATVLAAENHTLHPESPQEKRRVLAQDFVARLKNKLNAPQTAPLAIPAPLQESLPATAQSASGMPVTSIAVGTEMQFRPRVGKTMLGYDIYAVRGEDDFFLSLADLVATLDFPISIDDDSRTAQGWFLREDWPFMLDAAASTVRARGNEYVLNPADIRDLGGEMFIASRALGEWLDMKYVFNIGYQEMEIDSAWPLPVVARILRQKKQGGGRGVYALAAELPREEFDYEWFNLNAADLSLRTDYYRPGEGRGGNTSHRGDVYIAGEALKHDAFLMAGGDDREGLTSVVARLSRVSEEPELLGFMKARSYMLGDIEVLNVPLLGDSARELGFRVSNNPLSAISFQDTRITGQALPGWDIELYRGTTLIDSQTVDETGRYAFEDIQLYAGDNDFDVFFYGAHGEVRKESVSIPLNIATLQTQSGTYDISAGLKETQTYQNPESEKEDKDTPHVAGQYNFMVGDALAYTGFNAIEENGKSKFYAGAGLTTLIAGAIANLNAGVDEEGELAGRLELRRTIAEWRLASSVQVQGDRYTPGNITVPATLQMQTAAQRDFKPLIGSSLSVSLSSNYQKYANDSESRAVGLSIGQGFSRVSFSNAISYEESTASNGDSSDTVTDDFAVRARLTSKLLARAGLSYQIRPESHMDRYFANLQYRPSNNLSFETEVQHSPERDYSDLQLRANYTNQRLRFSPFLRYDSDSNLSAGLNVSTSLVDSPDSTWPIVTSERLSAQGMVSAQVFLDANGNTVFDEGDEVLSDVIVESVNSFRREKTNEKGYALLTRLPTTLATDIKVDASSLPDPFMIPVNEGRSVLPRAGSTFEMTFPVQFASEIDGNVYAADGAQRNPAKFTSVVLLPTDPLRESITARAAQDGFYLLSAVPPGQYFLTVSDRDMKDMGALRPMPQFLNFTHKGETIYANNLTLTKGMADIQFAVLDPAAMAGWQGGEAVFLRIPQAEKGGLLNLMHRLRMRDVSGRVVAGLARHEFPDAAAGEAVARYLVPGARDNALPEAWARCEMMARENLPCMVEIVPAAAPASMPVEQTMDAPAKAADAKTSAAIAVAARDY